MPLDRRLNRRSLRWGLMRDADKCHRHTANITAAPDLMAETSGKWWSSYGIWAWDGQPDQTGLLWWFRVVWDSCQAGRTSKPAEINHCLTLMSFQTHMAFILQWNKRSTFVRLMLFGSKHSTKYLLLQKKVSHPGLEQQEMMKWWQNDLFFCLNDCFKPAKDQWGCVYLFSRRERKRQFSGQI